MTSSSILPKAGLSLWNGLLHLFFPHLCVGCNADLPALGSCFCLPCRLKLAPANLSLDRENEFTDRFWGRLPIESGAAMYYFSRKSPIQRALHQLKYQNQPDIGVRLGREFGRQLKLSDLYKGVDALIPVPLHPKKERLRGYNQSACFAEGLAESMGLKVLHQHLIRQAFAVSQTKKKRLERFENVNTSFAVARQAPLEGKHILLVDDVLTTGATLESCGRVLLQIPGLRLSLATIAIAMNKDI